MSPELTCASARFQGELIGTAVSPDGSGDTIRYDSSSSPEVFSRAAVKRCWTLSQFAMFQNAFT